MVKRRIAARAAPRNHVREEPRCFGQLLPLFFFPMGLGRSLRLLDGSASDHSPFCSLSISLSASAAMCVTKESHRTRGRRKRAPPLLGGASGRAWRARTLAVRGRKCAVLASDCAWTAGRQSGRGRFCWWSAALLLSK